MVDENWSDMTAWSLAKYDIDNNFHYWECYLAVRVNGMEYWQSQILHMDDVEFCIVPNLPFKFLWDKMVERVDERVKEGNA